jgi:GH24 family phage-related lysozyme (muramidase)
VSKDAAGSLTLSETELEQVRSDREALEWLHDYLAAEGALETVQPGGAPSATPISGEAFDLIVEFEVSGEQAYTKKYRKPVWPEGQSGVTIGIGYDVGYASKPQLWADWGGPIPDAMIAALESALGVTGTPANAVAKKLQARVDVPWQSAIKVHREKVLPRWVGLVERSLPNAGMIGPDCLGALVSLTYNRGASFGKAGARFREMRNIKTHMAAKAFAEIPDEFRSMARLWPKMKGLQKRREREARLFEKGLSALPSA